MSGFDHLQVGQQNELTPRNRPKSQHLIRGRLRGQILQNMSPTFRNPNRVIDLHTSNSIFFHLKHVQKSIRFWLLFHMMVTFSRGSSDKQRQLELGWLCCQQLGDIVSQSWIINCCNYILKRLVVVFRVSIFFSLYASCLLSITNCDLLNPGEKVDYPHRLQCLPLIM